MISVACSSFFQRTAASLVVSYLLILPLAIARRPVLERIWKRWPGATVCHPHGRARIVCMAIIAVLFRTTTARLLHPPDVGSEGKEVVDIERESAAGGGPGHSARPVSRQAVRAGQAQHSVARRREPGLRQGDAQRDLRQGTLMLRLVIQVSMLLAIPLMAVCLYLEAATTRPGTSATWCCSTCSSARCFPPAA